MASHAFESSPGHEWQRVVGILKPMKRLHLALALHNHQPVGNFEWVLEKLYQDSYLPMVDRLEAHPSVKTALHYTGFLLEWLDAVHPELLDRVAALAERGQVEMLGGGHFEPILPAIPDRDKHAQLTRMRDAVERRFGRRPRGLWLAERVWEASLARPLAEAGYRYTILDDSHFEAVGLTSDELFTPFLTEEGGHPLTLLATGTKMRYLIPWRDVEESLAYFQETASEQPRMVLMGDDGEKFGGWPGPARLCWGRRWVDRFFEMLEANSGWLESVLPGEYVERAAPRGPVYLPAGSYPEMNRWSGGFWRNFIARYPEVNALHKKMLRVSAKVAAAGSPSSALTELLRGQANDVYWHGVFGGVYLPHLRQAAWRSLLAAEAAIGPGDGVAHTQVVDYDLDGHCEVLIEGPAQNVYLAPAAGGAVVEWDAGGRNAADCLARRPEVYHDRLRGEGDGGGVSKLEAQLRVREPGLAKRLQYDPRRRLVMQAYLVAPGANLGEAVRAELTELGGFAAGRFELTGPAAMERTESLTVQGRPVSVRMAKSFRISQRDTAIGLDVVLSAQGGSVQAQLVVESNLALPSGPADGQVGGRSLRRPADLGNRSEVTLRQPAAGVRYRLRVARGGRVWYYPVETVNNSESGYERIVQGACLVAVLPVRLGESSTRYSFRLQAIG
jgi:alpha-amylase